jgi:hypothetical protein
VIRCFSVDFSKELKLVWAGLRTVSGDGRTSGFYDPIVIIARGGWEVCDGAHGRFVMKKRRGSDAILRGLPNVITIVITSEERHG